jgi:hypothetical protein
MKKIFTQLFVAALLCSSATLFAQAPVPELLYYRFNGTGTNVPNEASAPPAGTLNATIVGGLTQGPTGQCGGALIGNGQTSTSNYVNTNWATDLNGTSWTISFWTSNIPSTTSTYYILGDVNAGGLRVFTGGVAGAGNWILRGGFADILATGGAAAGPTLTTFVYDMPANEMRAYVNGALVSTIAQPSVSILGPGPFKVGGYSSSNNLPPSSLMDEFRLYNRALTVAEIQSLAIMNTTSTINPVSCNSVYTAPSGATYNTAGTYVDVIPNINGCDSTITINLSFVPPVTSALSETACDNYTAPSGAVFTASGTYNDTILTVGGCDSVITISLTVNSSSTSVIAPTACSIYTAPSGATYTTSGTYFDVIPNAMGCDSTIAINLTILSVSSSTISPVSCGMYTSPSGPILMWSGTYYDTIPNAAGCDSIITINLTVNDPTTATISPVVCASYTAPSGAMYTTSGIYMDTIPNTVACDSVITINLTVEQTFASIAPMACDSFITPGGIILFSSGMYMDTITNMAGCDSIISINLTVGNNSFDSISAFACNSYTAPSGAMFNTTGVYTDVIQNASGCDSTITINLVVNTVNAAATQNNAVLTATATGATYQWVNCPSMSPISGATSQSYTATANGNYAVIVSENNCTDTSVCFGVTGIGIVENGFGGMLNVYPNPSEGEFFIDLGTVYNDVTIVVTDIAGRVVYSQLVNSANIIPVTINEAAGIYVISVTSGNESAKIKLVKE